MEEYPYTEVVDGKEYTYINMGTYYVTNLETGDRRLVQRQVPFLFGEDYDAGTPSTEDTECMAESGEILNPFKAEETIRKKQEYKPNKWAR